MSDAAVVFWSLKSFSNAAVWQNYKDSQCSLAFTSKTLIYGFNGSGKTTLSRAFSSIERGELEARLPNGASFEFQLSDGGVVKSADLTNPFGKNLLVFNYDFIERNLKWDESTAAPIFFLSEESIEKKKAYDEAKAALAEAEAEKLRALSVRTAANKTFRDFKTDTARRVRDIVPGQKFTQSFDARKIEGGYSVREYSDDNILSEEVRTHLQGLLGADEPLPTLEKLQRLSHDLAGRISVHSEQLSKSPGRVMAAEFSKHPEAMRWVNEGLHYHEKHNLDTCILCGNGFTDERKEFLTETFDSTWDRFVEDVRSAKDECDGLISDMQRAKADLHSVHDIQQAERAEYTEARLAAIALFDQAKGYLASLFKALDKKLGNPSATVPTPSLPGGRSAEEFMTALEKTISEVNESIDRHNSLHDNFSDRQLNAFDRLRDHVLAEEQATWSELVKAKAEAENMVAKAGNAINEARERFQKLNDEVRSHGRGADQLNGLLTSYLGHKGIRLESLDAGYQLIRGDGQPAKQLSEGEKTAVAFCFFLTQLEAEGRNRKELVVVIDDPISSLDTSARTHAFSLLHRMTKKCAQVIVLTHNMSFMNMVKRSFCRLGDDCAGLFALECKSISDEPSIRRTILIAMPSLLAKFDSEYQYLYSMVHEASETDKSDFHFMLPNATRKLLEIFTRFAAPDKESFSEALLGGGVALEDHDVKSLERLIQVESHGTIEGMSALPSLTVEQALQATKAAMAYIRKRDKPHFDAMKRLCNKPPLLERSAKNTPLVASY